MKRSGAVPHQRQNSRPQDVAAQFEHVVAASPRT